MISYEFVAVRPQGLWVQIKYASDGKPDYFKGVGGVRDFSDAKLEEIAQKYAIDAQQHWEAMNEIVEPVGGDQAKSGEVKEVISQPAPEYDTAAYELRPTTEETATQIINGWALKSIVREPVPAFDEFSARLESTVTETETSVIYGFSLEPRPPEEQAKYREKWRGLSSVTPRQARLALASRGQLSGIDTIIASLPAEQQEVVQIEWEYAVSVERKSPWVIQLGAALGLDEQGLDELFKEAARL